MTIEKSFRLRKKTIVYKIMYDDRLKRENEEKRNCNSNDDNNTERKGKYVF